MTFWETKQGITVRQAEGEVTRYSTDVYNRSSCRRFEGICSFSWHLIHQPSARIPAVNLLQQMCTSRPGICSLWKDHMCVRVSPELISITTYFLVLLMTLGWCLFWSSFFFFLYISSIRQLYSRILQRAAGGRSQPRLTLSERRGGTPWSNLPAVRQPCKPLQHRGRVSMSSI